VTLELSGLPTSRPPNSPIGVGTSPWGSPTRCRSTS
jgi:hypothetical protein